MKREPATSRAPKTSASSSTHPFDGHWHLTEMELWDREALDLLGPAFIRFGRDGLGEFRFIAVQGGLDCRFGERGNLPSVEFSWEGEDEGDQRTGRGWAILQDGVLEGRWYFHRGDDSWFIAKRGVGPGPRQATRRRLSRTRERA